MSYYTVFKDKNNLTDEDKKISLTKVVEKAVDHVITECGKHVSNYEYNQKQGFPGVKGMLAVINNDIFNKELMDFLKEDVRKNAVSRQYSVSSYELLDHGAINQNDEIEVAKNLEIMKEDILKIASAYKEDSITKFNLMEMKRHTNDMSYSELLPRIESCLRDHNYKILSAEEKIAFKMNYLNGKYPEAAVKDLVEKTYKEDLNHQLKCAYSIRINNVNDHKNAIHSVFKDLIQHTEDDKYNQSSSYGVKLTPTGLKLFNIKEDFAKKVLENFDDNFEVFYASVSKHLKSHVEDVSKLSMIDKLKNVAFGSNIDLNLIVKQNENLDIKSIIEEKNRNKLKM